MKYKIGYYTCFNGVIGNKLYDITIDAYSLESSLEKMAKKLSSSLKYFHIQFVVIKESYPYKYSDFEYVDFSTLNVYLRTANNIYKNVRERSILWVPLIKVNLGHEYNSYDLYDDWPDSGFGEMGNINSIPKIPKIRELFSKDTKKYKYNPKLEI